MQTNKLMSIRIEQGKNTTYMGNLIDKSPSLYRQRERGLIKFTPKEIDIIVEDLKISKELSDYIFLDKPLQKCKTTVQTA